MFMITAWGTAVVVRNAINPIQNSNSKEIDKDVLKERANIIRLASASLTDSFKITLKELQIIVDTRSVEFKEILLSKYKALDSLNFGSNDDYKEAVKLYNEYFAALLPEDVIPLLYKDLLTETRPLQQNKVLELIKQNDLLDYDFIKQLLNANISKRKFALEILQADKPTYNIEDIIALENIISSLKEAFPQNVTIEFKKGFLSSTEKEVWTCSCGTSNSVNTVHCGGCLNDKHGLKENELKLEFVLASLNNKLIALKSML